MRRKYFFVLGLILILAVFVSAGFEATDHYVSSIYGEDSEISGWIEIELTDMSIDSLFTDSMGNSIQLRDVLETPMNSNFDYNCSYDGCQDKYSKLNVFGSNSFLGNSESIILGVELIGVIDKINSIKFDITSNAGPSCESQMKIDLSNDEDFEIMNSKSSYEICSGRNYGCFNPQTIPQEVKITSTPFCQKIEFIEAPGYRIGAWIKEDTPGTDNLYAAIYDLDGNLIEKCGISKATLSGTGGNSYCDVDFSLREKEENYVCIYTNGTESSNRGIFLTRGYTSGEVCGFVGLPPSEEINSYEIYSQGKKFNSVGTLEILDDSSEVNISDEFEEYILEKYGSFDCTDGCIVPFRVEGFEDQNITVQNFVIDYETSLGNSISGLNVYELEKISSKVDAEPQKLYLDSAGFKLVGTGEMNYLLDFDGEEILDEEIEIKSFSLNVAPTKTAIEYPTTFKITTTPSTIIESSDWDFGDNSSGSVARGEITHTYMKKGTYNGKVVATNNGSITFTKEFVVIVGSPSEIIENVLNELDSNILGLKNQLLDFGLFERGLITNILNLTYVEQRVDRLGLDFKTAQNETEEILIMKELVGINLPEKISTISTNNIPYYVKEGNINLDYLDEMSFEPQDILREDLYVEAILAWNVEKLDTRISMEEFYFERDGVRTLALKVFDLDVFEKSSVSSKHFFIEDLRDLNFKTELEEKEGYCYANLDETDNIVFSTSEDIDYDLIPMFIAPDISDFNLVNIVDVPKKGLGLWFWVVIVLVLIGGVIGYFYLERWYAQKYEDSLFPNKNNLYNLINYIQVEKDKGLSNSKIKSKLRPLWSSEQIRYVMKKYGGENTGMYRLFHSKRKVPLPPRPNNFNTQKFNK